MDTQSYFNLRRIVYLMKRDFVENWKHILLIFVLILLAYLGILLFVESIFEAIYHIQDFGSDKFLNDCAIPYLLIALFALFIGASFILQNMQKKESRVSYIMLPASSLEKFIARLLYVTVGLTLIILLSSLFAEIIFWISMPHYYIPKIWIWPEIWGGLISQPFSFLSYNTSEALLVNTKISGPTEVAEGLKCFKTTILIPSIIWFHSLYILGGCLWYKWAFMKTTIIYLFANIVFTNILHFDQLYSEYITMFNYIFPLLALFNLWLSYQLFCRSQIIKNKFRWI